MFYTSVQAIRERDVARYCWSSLRRFHHVPSLTDFLMHVHSVPKKYKPDVAKQASQIRQCLIQAREYRDAAEITSLATKPTLIYYSIMSLALAQVLVNGSGDQSLDRARAEHKHHGLEFHVGPDLKGDYDIARSATNLRATPMISAGRRRGTFALWCQQSQEDPAAGENTVLGGSLNRIGPAILLQGATKGFCVLEREGITLLDCLKSIPSMIQNSYFVSDIVRASISRREQAGNAFISVMIHPHWSANHLSNLAEAFKFDANSIEDVALIEGEGHFNLTVREDPTAHRGFFFPSAATWRLKEHRFMSTARSMNEFGYLYLAMYMLGNYARYYPDRWILDVDQGTPLALLADILLQSIDERAILLTLSELSGTAYVVAD